jgi:hypothetical protein
MPLEDTLLHRLLSHRDPRRAKGTKTWQNLTIFLGVKSHSSRNKMFAMRASCLVLIKMSHQLFYKMVSFRDPFLFSLHFPYFLLLLIVLCFGTENRPTSKAVAATSALLPFVSFPGNEIKDLFVHEEIPEELPPPPVKSNLPQPSSQNKSQNKFPPRSDQQEKQKPLPKPRNYTAPSAPTTSAGTGEHLLKLKERTTTGSSAMENPVGEFDFESGLTSFKKDVVLAEVAEEATSNGVLAGRYIKDNFFDTLSSSVDPDIARKDRMTAGEERVLNQDTFGAIALQQNYRRGGRGGNGRGNGRGGYNYRGRGNGRGGYQSNNNGNGNGSNPSNNSNGNSNYRGENNNRRGRGNGYGNRQATNKAGPDER